MATNFLKYCTGSADGMALAVGVSSVECATSVGRMCIGSREGAASSELRGSGLRISFWGSFIASFPLPPSVSNGEIASFCCLQCSSTVVSIRHSSSIFSSSG